MCRAFPNTWRDIADTIIVPIITGTRTTTMSLAGWMAQEELVAHLPTITGRALVAVVVRRCLSWRI